MIQDVKGAGFPFRIDESSGGVAWASGREKIRQNLRVILGTRAGERPMLREFGTRLHSLLHSPNDEELAELVENQIRQSLLQWEPRILVTSAKVEREEGELRLRIEYVHTAERVVGQMVLPLS